VQLVTGAEGRFASFGSVATALLPRDRDRRRRNGLRSLVHRQGPGGGSGERFRQSPRAVHAARRLAPGRCI